MKQLLASGTAAALFCAAFVAGCAPSLSPLYRDYEAPETDSASVDARVLAALEEAGWDTVQTEIPNAIATDERVLSNWGIYKVTASLEVTPLGADHVRVYVHPFRKYIFGGRGKIVYLTRRIRSKFMPQVNEAFEQQRLHLAGTPFERDDTTLR